MKKGLIKLLMCKAPLLYTTWTLVFAGVAVTATALGVRVRGSVWRAAFALLVGACVVGTFLANMYYEPTMDKYGVSRPLLVVGDVLFHILPFIFILLARRWMAAHAMPDNENSRLEMIGIVTLVGLVYAVTLGTSMYPGDPCALVLACIAATAGGVWGFQPE